jgi:serine/threonine protein kinase/WD40 repeat protein
MNTDFENVRQTFLEIVEQPAAQWESLLNAACANDPGLRQQVAVLLQAHVKSEGILDRNQAGQAATGVFESLSERPGTAIGPYKLLQQIGEGGMGVVWMAEQSQPVQRKVALKVIKPGMDSRQVVARFEAERQALALMDHVNIARVFDGGATESGRPYFVMELVHGVPITKCCDDQQLTPRARLELFVPVCQAIQHAHQKGIIHRDVKPSNVMIALYDGKPVPKVIDFGVAKATEQKLTERTLFTQHGTLVGTLEYMSPEQAEMSALGIDTRSDIYSLGVLLYELLTGSTPLSHQRVKETAYAEILRIIKDEEPPRPSMRLHESGEALASISAQRHTEPAKLAKLLRGELDWIVMMTLEKDRNRRYETANGLAADVQRYLADEPVHAHPPSTWYRLRKLARRNKGILSTAGAIALALVLGTAVSMWQAIRATDAEWLAQERLVAEMNAKNAAERAQVEAKHGLYNAKLEQAKAGRFSRRVGQRFASLDAVAEAAKIARELKLPEKQFLELRNTVIACLALPDLRVAREWNGWRSDDQQVDFDGTLELYACTNRQGVCSIRRSADGTEVANLPPRGGVRTSDGSAANPILSRDGGYVAVCYHPSVGFAGLRMWKLGGNKPTLLVDEPLVSSFNFSPCNRWFAFGVARGPIKVIELPSGRLLSCIDVDPDTRYLAFHPKLPQFAVASRGTKIRICDLNSGKVLAELLQPAAGVETIDWHPEGNVLAVGGQDRIIYLWDVAARTQIARLEGHKDYSIRLAFNHAGDLLASLCWDGILRLWDPRTGLQLFNTQTTVQALRFSPDDGLLAADIDGNNLRFLEVAPIRAYRTLVRDPVLGRGVYLDCSTSPKNRCLAVGMTDGVGLWDVATGDPLTFLPFTGNTGALFEPSGALLTFGRAGVLRWPIAGDSAAPGLVRIGPPQELPLPGSDNQIACSRDGWVLASAQYWGGLVWHQDLPGPPIRLPPHEDTRFISVSPDNRWVATGSFHGTKVKIWNARTAEPVHELPVETASAVRFSPDGRWLATSGGGCRVWAVDGWKEGPLIGDKGNFAFSPDAKILAVGTGFGVVRLVNPDTGGEYARLEDPNQDRSGEVTFTADGAQLVTTSGDSNSVHVWDLRTIRAVLAKMDLDWGLPSYPPAEATQDHRPLKVVVDARGLGPEFAKPSTPSEAKRPPPPSSEMREAWRQEMQRRAKTLKLARMNRDASVPVESLPAALYRYDEPDRDLYEATVWAWGRVGRPVALAALEFYARPEGGARAMYELVSLADGPIKAQGDGGRWHWSPKQPGVVLQEFPGAGTAAESEMERLKQMKDLAMQLTASYGGGPHQKGTELRLLPEPIHRYADADSGLQDGAIFVFAHGSNPEIVVLIEARGNLQSGAKWHCGFARLSAAGLSVSLAGRDVWTQSAASLASSQESYWIVVEPYTPR